MTLAIVLSIVTLIVVIVSSVFVIASNQAMVSVMDELHRRLSSHSELLGGIVEIMEKMADAQTSGHVGSRFSVRVGNDEMHRKLVEQYAERQRGYESMKHED